jgi:multidrug transporter EmrE-like cation transporter
MEYILPIVSIEALGDWGFTKFVQEDYKHPWYRVLGYVCYIGVLELFQKSIAKKGLAWTNSAWDGWSNIATGAVALFIFKEKPSLKEFLGIILISVGLLFLGTDGIASYKSS